MRNMYTFLIYYMQAHIGAHVTVPEIYIGGHRGQFIMARAPEYWPTCRDKHLLCGSHI